MKMPMLLLVKPPPLPANRCPAWLAIAVVIAITTTGEAAAAASEGGTAGTAVAEATIAASKAAPAVGKTVVATSKAFFPFLSFLLLELLSDFVSKIIRAVISCLSGVVRNTRRVFAEKGRGLPFFSSMNF